MAGTAAGALVGAAGPSTRPALARYYADRLPPIVPGAFTFTSWLLRGGHVPLDITAMCSSIEWDDEGAVLGGTVTLQHPDRGRVWVERGHEIRLDTVWNGQSYVLWTMRCESPQETVEESLSTITVADEMDPLRRDRLDWSFLRTASRPRGWTCDEITRAVAARLGMRLGPILQGQLYQHFTLKNASGLQAIAKAYQAEQQANGLRYVMRMVDGAFTVIEFQRNPLLYVLGKQIVAALTSDSGQASPVTVVTGYGYVGEGHARRQLKSTVYDQRTVQQLGYVPAQHHFGRVNSQADLESRVKRMLAADLLANLTASVTHPGIPFIRRGDGVELFLAPQGFTGANAFCYCSAVHHTIEAGQYQTELDVSTLDPFAGKKAQQQLYNETSTLTDETELADLLVSS